MQRFLFHFIILIQVVRAFGSGAPNPEQINMHGVDESLSSTDMGDPFVISRRNGRRSAQHRLFSRSDNGNTLEQPRLNKNSLLRLTPLRTSPSTDVTDVTDRLTPLTPQSLPPISKNRSTTPNAEIVTSSNLQDDKFSGSKGSLLYLPPIQSRWSPSPIGNLDKNSGLSDNSLLSDNLTGIAYSSASIHPNDEHGINSLKSLDKHGQSSVGDSHSIRKSGSLPKLNLSRQNSINSLTGSRSSTPVLDNSLESIFPMKGSPAIISKDLPILPKARRPSGSGTSSPESIRAFNSNGITSLTSSVVIEDIFPHFKNGFLLSQYVENAIEKHPNSQITDSTGKSLLEVVVSYIPTDGILQNKAALLISNGAHTNYPASNRGSLLMAAISNNNQEMCEILIKNGISVNGHLHAEGGDRSLVGEAIRNKLTKVIIQMVFKGAKLSPSEKNDQYFLNDAIQFSQQQKNPTLTCSLAALGIMKSSIITVKGVEMSGVYYAFKNRLNWLLIALVQNGETFLEKEKEYSISDTKIYNDQQPLIFDPIHAEQVDVAIAVIKAGANVNSKAKTDAEFSPLILAATSDSLMPIMELLLERGANIDYQSRNGGSALHYAVSTQNIENTQLLIRHKASLNLRDLQGFTPLHHAVKKGNYNLVKILLKAGADKQIRDNSGRLPSEISVDHSALKALF